MANARCGCNRELLGIEDLHLMPPGQRQKAYFCCGRALVRHWRARKYTEMKCKTELELVWVFVTRRSKPYMVAVTSEVGRPPEDVKRELETAWNAKT